ncbi:hypothetical protein [Ruegeria meonggei]|uniref:Uncharacterized protein n=1 Tax=Ruegeria meonggei TaxID=1446476 RepID=A0A1X6YC74_9RHOB|nr:hypothetical protein [Ruegeria meonggei]SLN16690.1 hypothetical protein RUM8411_00537 [Ruegeria meonggei]
MSSKGQFQSGNTIPENKRSFGTDRFAFRAALVVAVLVLIVIAIWPMQASVFNQEGGPFETISAAALFVAGLASLYRFSGIKRLYIGLVCLLLAERELEADVYAVDSLPYFVLHGLDVLLDMTIVRVVLAVLVLGGLFWHGVPNAWRALKQRAPFLLIFFLAGMCAVVAQSLEEISSAFDAEMSEVMVTRLFVLEETLEMFFSIGILAAVLIGWPKSSTEENVNDQVSKPDPR